MNVSVLIPISPNEKCFAVLNIVTIIKGHFIVILGGNLCIFVCEIVRVLKYNDFRGKQKICKASQLWTYQDFLFNIFV